MTLLEAQCTVRNYTQQESGGFKIKLFDFGKEGIFDKNMAIISNTKNEQLIVYTCVNISHTLQGARNATSSAFLSYGATTDVAAMRILDLETRDTNDSPALNDAQKMKDICEKINLSSNRESNLAGSGVVIAVDPQKSQLLQDKELQQGVGFLFGSEGPYKNILITPLEGQDSLMQAIENNDGHVAWSQLENKTDYFKIKNVLLNDYKVINQDVSENVSIVNALLAYIPYYAHLYTNIKEDRENFTADAMGTQMEYVLSGLRSHLPTPIPSQSALESPSLVAP